MVWESKQRKRKSALFKRTTIQMTIPSDPSADIIVESPKRHAATVLEPIVLEKQDSPINKLNDTLVRSHAEEIKKTPQT